MERKISIFPRRVKATNYSTEKEKEWILISKDFPVKKEKKSCLSGDILYIKVYWQYCVFLRWVSVTLKIKVGSNPRISEGETIEGIHSCI